MKRFLDNGFQRHRDTARLLASGVSDENEKKYFEL